MLNKNIRTLIVVVCFGVAATVTFAANELAGTKITTTIKDTKTFSVDEKVALPALVSLIDGHIQKVADCLTLAAMTDEVKSSNWDEMKDLLGEVAKVNLPAVIWFIRPDGSYYTTETGFIAGQNLKDRDYFPIVMTGKPVIGSLVVSKSTGKKSVIVTVPVMNKDKIIGAVGASIFLEQFSDLIIKEMSLPDGIIFYALDNNAQTVIHRDAFRIFQNPTQLGNDTLATGIKQIMSRPEGSVEYIFQGANRVVYFQTSPLTGWRIVLGKVVSITVPEIKTGEK
jgi:hypothetical protein